jgi:Ca2+-transporting ATPase
LALSVRSEENSLAKIGLLSNRPMVWAILSAFVLQLAVLYLPFMQRIFETQGLSWRELLIALGCSLIVWLVVEVQKWFVRRQKS